MHELYYKYLQNKEKVVSLQPKVNYIGLRNRKSSHSKPI